MLAVPWTIKKRKAPWLAALEMRTLDMMLGDAHIGRPIGLQFGMAGDLTPLPKPRAHLVQGTLLAISPDVLCLLDQLSLNADAQLTTLHTKTPG
jgi:hypothetical protein